MSVATVSSARRDDCFNNGRHPGLEIRGVRGLPPNRALTTTPKTALKYNVWAAQHCTGPIDHPLPASTQQANEARSRSKAKDDPEPSAAGLKGALLL